MSLASRPERVIRARVHAQASAPNASHILCTHPAPNFAGQAETLHLHTDMCISDIATASRTIDSGVALQPEDLLREIDNFREEISALQNKLAAVRQQRDYYRDLHILEMGNNEASRRAAVQMADLARRNQHIWDASSDLDERAMMSLDELFDDEDDQDDEVHEGEEECKDHAEHEDHVDDDDEEGDEQDTGLSVGDAKTRDGGDSSMGISPVDSGTESFHKCWCKKDPIDAWIALCEVMFAESEVQGTAMDARDAQFCVCAQCLAAPTNVLEDLSPLSLRMSPVDFSSNDAGRSPGWYEDSELSDQSISQRTRARARAPRPEDWQDGELELGEEYRVTDSCGLDFSRVVDDGLDDYQPGVYLSPSVSSICGSDMDLEEVFDESGIARMKSCARSDFCDDDGGSPRNLNAGLDDDFSFDDDLEEGGNEWDLPVLGEDFVNTMYSTRSLGDAWMLEGDSTMSSATAVSCVF